jgi:hypothetical protein
VRSPRITQSDLEPLIAAGANQDQVIAKLQEMLGRLSEWEDYRQLAHDITALRGQQKTVSEETAGLATTGRDVRTLSSQQRAELKRLAQRQLDLTREFDRLHSRMSQTRNALAESDPPAAAALADALRVSEQRDLSGQMRQTAGHVEANQIGRAAQRQTDVLQGLDELRDALARRGKYDLRETSQRAVARLLARLRRAAEGWLERQRLLVEETRQQAADFDSARLESIGGRQRTLCDDVQAFAQTPLLADTFGFGLERAAQPMQTAAELLEQGIGDDRTEVAQREALRRLQMVYQVLPEPPDPTKPPASKPQGQTDGSSDDESSVALTLAELKLLRVLQREINDRTSELAERSRRAASLSEDEQREVALLAADQGRLADVVQALVPPASPTPDEDPTRPLTPPRSNLERALEKAGIPGFGED